MLNDSKNGNKATNKDQKSDTEVTDNSKRSADSFLQASIRMEEKKMSKHIATRSGNYSQWYLDLIRVAGLASESPVRGCMVIEPYGYSIWENIQRALDPMIKEAGVENAYYPLFIPVKFLEQEEKHAKGFAKEVAVVTHHRLVADDNGHLIPALPLEEPLIVRPTSETIMYHMFAKDIQSYRNLPYLRNQWCNIVRWEMRTKPFLRTMEFLWQEGHTAHATKDEADKETLRALEMYRVLVEEFLAIPVIRGYKTETEKFAGADYTTCIEAMTQDKKALQAGTSHQLGQNFAKNFKVKYLDANGQEQFVWQTSWGLSTRIIGALIMTHSDDNGLVLPPKIAPIHVALIPIFGPNPEEKLSIQRRANEVADVLRKEGIIVKVDNREGRPGFKFFEWEKKGVPVRIEFGPKDLANNSCIVVRRDTSQKESVSLDGIIEHVRKLLTSIQHNLFDRATKFRDDNTFSVDTWDQFVKYIPELKLGQEITEDEYETAENGAQGFLLAHWCGEAKCEEEIKTRTKATIRCIPFDQPEEDGGCILCGKKSRCRVIFAKSY